MSSGVAVSWDIPPAASKTTVYESLIRHLLDGLDLDHYDDLHVPEKHRPLKGSGLSW